MPATIDIAAKAAVAAADPALVKRVRRLVYTAVDIGSPKDLSEHPATSTLAKIADTEFVYLEMMPTGIGYMWQTINAYLPSYELNAVKASTANLCKTPRDVWEAVLAANPNLAAADIEG